MRSPLNLERSTPALIVKVGQYPIDQGGLGTARSLGRLGVPVYAITENRRTPLALCRYLRAGFPWPMTGFEDTGTLVRGLLDIGRQIGRPTVLFPTDDEAAVLISEQADALAENFIFPRTPEAPLVRRLSSKQGLHDLCVRHGVPSPPSVAPRSLGDVEIFAATARFPVVAKSREAFQRRRAPAVRGTTVIAGPEELLGLARGWAEDPGVVLQEYLPKEEAEDWIVHGYFDADCTPRALFTGVKVRSWPPHTGVTACAFTVENPELSHLARDFVRKVGFRGIVDLDWRYDRRDRRYKLLDFNPRVGAQFRLFETTAEIDVVRAQYLDLTGQAVPPGEQVKDRRYILENLDPPARLLTRDAGCTTPHRPERTAETELAWFARDDLKPFFGMIPLMTGPTITYLRRELTTRRKGA